MKAEDWPRVEELFHLASGLGDAERAEYLARECADEEQRREVEELVAAFESNRSFMEMPLLDDGLRLLSSDPAGSLAGSTLGHYKVLSLIGQGGMGEVYLAEDGLLERPVALKFINPGLVGDDWAREQLMKEARAVARLEHQNICAVYAVEEVEGRDFIVMPYVEGEPLDALLRRGAPGLERVLDLAEQIVSALAAAHSRGIIHRDVKPQNIVVTDDGRAKVLDFGIAKLIRQKQGAEHAGDAPARLPLVTAVVGTYAYMSPEQARGEELDQRSDIFSFGIVLYEMLGGGNPFLRVGRNETAAAITSEEPPPLSNLPLALADGLERIARKCLEKEPGRRYATAEQLLRELRELRDDTHRSAAPPLQLVSPTRFPALRRHPRSRTAAALALLIICSAVAGYLYVKLSHVPTLAVLPIVNASGDSDGDYLSVGLTRSLSDKFSYLPRLKLKLPSVVPSNNGESGDLAQFGQELEADAVLSGRVFKQGDSLRLRLSLLKAPDASQLWEGTFDLNNAANIFLLQDEVTKQVSAHLDLLLVSGERGLLTKRQTDSEEALRLYMRGRYYWSRSRTRENVQEAIRLFDRAVALDPSFAKAYTGLADCYALTTNVAYGPAPRKEAIDRALYNARQALTLDDTLPEAHTSMGLILMNYTTERKAAEKEFLRAIEFDPNYAQAHFWYASLLAISGHFDESIREGEVARSLDPYSPQAELNYGRALYYARRYDEAEAHFDKMIERSPDYLGFTRMKGYVLLQEGRFDEAVELFKAAHAKDPMLSAAGLGYAYGKAGRREEALAALRELDALSTPERPVPVFEKALVYIGLGERDTAFELLNRAYDEQFFQLLNFFTTDPIYDDLHADPRYADFARRLNLTP